MKYLIILGRAATVAARLPPPHHVTTARSRYPVLTTALKTSSAPIPWRNLRVNRTPDIEYNLIPAYVLPGESLPKLKACIRINNGGLNKLYYVRLQTQSVSCGIQQNSAPSGPTFDMSGWKSMITNLITQVKFLQ
ncbi:hypothetical protein CS542_09200 [Pedobacter sp. IW39]|nr:hypothetical protein CS542_09200 [Pedobacter sp. IW39]